MNVIRVSRFPASIEVRLPLSKSEGLRRLVLSYIMAKGRGDVALPPLREEASAVVPEDLLVMRDGLTALLGGCDEIRLSASASVARFLLALTVASGRPHRLLLADPQLQRRPMKPLFDFFRSIGVSIEVSDDLWRVDPRSTCVPRGAIADARGWKSSQFVSSLIYFSVCSSQPLTILRSRSESSAEYIILTIESLRSIGVDIRWIGDRIEVLRDVNLISYARDPAIAPIPGDWTSVSYWVELLLLHPEVRSLILTPLDLSSVHPDRTILSLLEGFLTCEEEDHRIVLQRDASHPELLALDLRQNPDLFPALFATALGLGLRADFTGLDTLAYKESNRLDACLSIARDLGWGEDTFVLHGSDRLTYMGVPRETRPAQVKLEHRDDHRLAMAFGVLATALEGLELTIDDDGVTERSYPRFFSELCGLIDERDEEEK